ncbi:MAG: CAP domain-containing protein [Polyangia bacterium]
MSFFHTAIAAALAAALLAAAGCDDDGGVDDPVLVYCADLINDYRLDHGLQPLERSAELERCASDGAFEDSQSGDPHGHFIETSGCQGAADAENEIPGWPLGSYESVESIIEAGTEMMMNEGPGGGHFENILGDHGSVGCGYHVTEDDAVWVVQDFK